METIKEVRFLCSRVEVELSKGKSKKGHIYYNLWVGEPGAMYGKMITMMTRKDMERLRKAIDDVLEDA